MRYKRMIGEKIYLTALILEDANVITEWFNTPEITQYLGIHREIKSLEIVKEDIEKYIKTGAAFAIFCKEMDALVGVIVLSEYGFIEIIISKVEYRLKGFDMEAVELLLDYGFNLKNCRVIRVSAYSHDTATLALYEKLGFKQSVVKRERLIFGRDKFDEIYFDMLASEYFKRRQDNG